MNNTILDKEITSVLAKEIAEKIKEEYSIGIFTRFCDEPSEFYYVSDEDLTKLIKDILDEV